MEHHDKVVQVILNKKKKNNNSITFIFVFIPEAPWTGGWPWGKATPGVAPAAGGGGCCCPDGCKTKYKSFLQKKIIKMKFYYLD